MINYKLFFIAISLFACSVSLPNTPSLNDSKSERYKIMIEARDKREGFIPYQIYDIKELSNKYEVSKKVEIVQSSLYGDWLKNTSTILKDNFFSLTEDYILSHRKDSGCFTPQVLCTPSKIDECCEYIRKINNCSDPILKLIKNDKDLYKVVVYSGENETHIIEETFFYKDVFQPKECYGRNPMPLRVLDDMFMAKINEKYLSRVGFTENKYQFTITLPLTYKDVYICDIMLNYLK